MSNDGPCKFCDARGPHGSRCLSRQEPGEMFGSIAPVFRAIRVITSPVVAAATKLPAGHRAGAARGGDVKRGSPATRWS